jgi:hypothetical protein
MLLCFSFFPKRMCLRGPGGICQQSFAKSIAMMVEPFRPIRPIRPGVSREKTFRVLLSLRVPEQTPRFHFLQAHAKMGNMLEHPTEPQITLEGTRQAVQLLCLLKRAAVAVRNPKARINSVSEVVAAKPSTCRHTDSRYSRPNQFCSLLS